MACRKYTSKAGRAGVQGQRWMTTSLSVSACLLTATATALELDSQSLPTSVDGFEVANDEDSLAEEHIADPERQSPNPSACYDSETAEEEFELGDAPADESTTVAQQVEMLLGRNNSTTGVSVNDENNMTPGGKPDIRLTPVGRATLDVLKLCKMLG